MRIAQSFEFLPYPSFFSWPVVAFTHNLGIEGSKGFPEQQGVLQLLYRNH